MPPFTELTRRSPGRASPRPGRAGRRSARPRSPVMLRAHPGALIGAEQLRGKGPDAGEALPASSSSTRRAGSCDSRAATTAPDVPPPTTMTSKLLVSHGEHRHRQPGVGFRSAETRPSEDKPAMRPSSSQPDGGEPGPHRLAKLSRRGPLQPPPRAPPTRWSRGRPARTAAGPASQPELRNRRSPGDLEAAGEIGQHRILGQASVHPAPDRGGPEVLGAAAEDGVARAALSDGEVAGGSRSVLGAQASQGPGRIARPSSSRADARPPSSSSMTRYLHRRPEQPGVVAELDRSPALAAGRPRQRRPGRGGSALEDLLVGRRIRCARACGGRARRPRSR